MRIASFAQSFIKSSPAQAAAPHHGAGALLVVAIAVAVIFYDR
jgi:hypothetical protein